MDTTKTGRTTWLCMALALGGALAVQAADEALLSDEQLLEEGLTRKEEPFELQLGLNWRAYMYEHSALQTRQDRESDDAENWRDGNLDGGGWGVTFAIQRLTSRIEANLIASDYEFDLNTGDFDHHIETDRRDFELNWQELAGQSERGKWGWLLGVRYITLDERFKIVEQGDAKEPGVLDTAGDISWFLAEGGYWGKIEPFRQPFMNIYGNVKLFIGEADGIAREGTDLDAGDGNIEERYVDEYSVAYGLNGTLGVSFRIRKRIGLNIEYFREWLYSFDSTGSGIVVFPDNNDALFIENSHGINGYVSINW